MKSHYQSNTLLFLVTSIGLYTLLFISLYFLLPDGQFKSTSFLNWDAQHYAHIANTGYTNFLSEKGDERAFFPLLPLIWKSLKLSTIGICIFNAILFLTAQTLLFKTLKLRLLEALVLLSTPSLIFMFLPYTESLFFGSSVLIIFGMQKNKFSLVLTGFFIASLTRPAYSILLPAYLLTQILTTKVFKEGLKKTSFVTITLLLGTLIVNYIQFKDTGTWFGFIKAQANPAWNNSLRMPSLPFTTWADFPAKPIDALAFCFGVFSIIIIIIASIKRIKSNHIIPENESSYFATLYIAGICLAVLLFRGGNMYSLNRFVFGTAFFQILVCYVWRNHPSNKNTLLTIAGTIAIVWLGFNGFSHIKLIITFLTLLIYTISLLNLYNKNKIIKRLAILIAIVLPIIIQILFLKTFLNNEWVA